MVMSESQKRGSLASYDISTGTWVFPFPIFGEAENKRVLILSFPSVGEGTTK